jgi:predicted small lipoprotein YifL
MRPAMTNLKNAALLLMLGLTLAGCGEKPQVLSHSKKDSAPAWQGAANEFVAPGWKAGDEQAWNRQMQVRAQNQNEYLRTGGAAR